MRDRVIRVKTTFYILFSIIYCTNIFFRMAYEYIYILRIPITNYCAHHAYAAKTLLQQRHNNIIHLSNSKM